MGDNAEPLGRVTLAATTFYVNDLDAAVTWYEDVLGWTPLMRGTDAERYASYLVGGAILVLEPRTAALEAAAPGAESTTINLLVERDPAEVRAALLRRDVECGPVVASPHYCSFLFRDLDGNRYYASRPATEQAARDVLQVTATVTPSGAFT